MANKKITDATTATSVAGTDKVFLNQGGDLKQVDLNSAVANSQAVQTLNSNLGSKLEIFKPVSSDNKSFNIKESIIIYIAIINDLRIYWNNVGIELFIFYNNSFSSQHIAGEKTWKIVSIKDKTVTLDQKFFNIILLPFSYY